MHSAVNKRVLSDIAKGMELKAEYGIYIAPEEDNYYNIHFIISGPENTAYEGGLYHGLVRLNQNHPIGPPYVHMITPSGRFEPEDHPVSPTSRGICFTYTGWHPEQWSAVLSVSSVLIGFVSFMCDDSGEGTGMRSIITTNEHRKRLAIESHKRLLAGTNHIEIISGIIFHAKKRNIHSYKN